MVRFTTDEGKTVRQLPDTDTAWNYLDKLSYSKRVEVLPGGIWCSPFWIECGETGHDNA